MRTGDATSLSMHACVIDSFGGPEKFAWREIPIPRLDPHEVLVHVDTASVGPWDIKARRGLFSDGHDLFPIVLGADGAGTIVARGDAVQGFAIGDAVYGYLYGEHKGGFYAEYVAISAEHIAPIPESLDFREAGAIGVTGITALAGIDDALAVRAGQTVLVHGATGGVGTVAVQFAKRRGARVIGTMAGNDGTGLLQRLGVDLAIDSLHDDVVERVFSIAPGGLDSVLAFVGGTGIEHILDALRAGGRLAYPNGVTVPTRDGINARAFDGVPSPPAFARLSATIDAGPFEVPIDAVFPLADAAEAHRRFERGRVHGKIVLAVDKAEDAIEYVA